jgi:mannose-6-phosphate isomerase-like protein (cupin superfamily)
LNKFTHFSDQWSPRVVAQMNDYQFKLAKIQNEFTWHSHPDTDEVFLVVEGAMSIEFRDGRVDLLAGGRCMLCQKALNINLMQKMNVK